MEEGAGRSKRKKGGRNGTCRNSGCCWLQRLGRNGWIRDSGCLITKEARQSGWWWMRGVVGSSTDTRLFNPLQRQNMIPVSSQNTQRQNILKSLKYSFHRLKNIENLLTMWTNNRNKNMERANPPNLQNGYLQFRKAQFPNFQITAHERISKVPKAPSPPPLHWPFNFQKSTWFCLLQISLSNANS